MVNNQDDSYGFSDDRDEFMNVHSVPSGRLYRLQRELDNANDEEDDDEDDEEESA